ncbi:MAG: hypothetical protein BWY78_00032 [Alphaproteobacteria bacterium ADurb.Bin438]|nr:MAG: hypothetical protein BWY78_00032 [Alphaproteobacteria bacterium ADurb.Bin438]
MNNNDKTNKEILLFVGKEPEGVSFDDYPADDKWSDAWEKITSGKATIKEVGETYTKGNELDIMKKDVGSVFGFSGMKNRLRIAMVHIGYENEEIKSKEFEKYMMRTKVEMENLYGKNNIEIGFHIPKDKIEITSYGLEHFVVADTRECALLKKRLEKKSGVIDILDVRINPKLVNDNDYFGSGGGSIKYTSPGPSKNEDGSYSVSFKYLAEHELMHSISGITKKYNPIDFGDGYFRSLYEKEENEILSGCHQEFIPADKDGTPIKPKSKTMEKILEITTPKDENVFFVDKKGKKHKLLIINPGDNIMRGGDYDEKGVREEAIKNGNYITPAQKFAISDAINDYLIGERRRDANQSVQIPSMQMKTDTSQNAFKRSFKR